MSSPSPSPWKSRRLLAVTGTFAAACTLSFVFFPDFVVDDPHIVACAILGTASATWLFWGLILERRNRYSVLRGVMAGGLIGIAAHYFMWCLYTLSGIIAETFPTPIFIANPLTHFNIFLSSFSLTAISVFFLNFGTVLSGMLLGGVCGYFCRKARHLAGLP